MQTVDMDEPKAPVARTAWITLVVLAIGAAGLWRIELAIRWGWYDLAWGSNFHWAIPASILLFIFWVFTFAGAVSRRRRWLLVGSLILFGVLGYWITDQILPMLRLVEWWPMGGEALMKAKFIVALKLLAWSHAVFFAWTLGVPAAFLLLLRYVGNLRISLVSIAASLGLYLSAYPLAMATIWVTNHLGGADFTHTIKTGFIVPPLILALGFPIAASAGIQQRTEY